MREILFRAKRKNNRGWICGSLVKKVRGVYIISESITGCIADYTEHEVDPSTVCQYTGLTDKNGRRFEGDVFQASDGDYIQRYIIAWNEDSLEWSAECVGNPEGRLPLSEFKVGEIEVIGNIFDNPELIGEQP